MTARITDTTTFDLTSFAEELRAAPGNLDVGTRLWLENDAIRPLITREYSVGDTNYSEHTPDDPTLHDLENAGDTDIRFVTVELLA